MISTQDRDFLIILMNIENCIVNNDVATAELLCETVNAMSLSTDEINNINDTVIPEHLEELYKESDAYRVLTTGINCIANKEYKMKLLEANSILYSKDIKKMDEWINEIVTDTLCFDGELNEAYYAKILIRICSITKRYDKMDIVRRKLEEVS